MIQRAVNQGGRRAGAVTVSLDVWHLDLPEFLEMQTENGDGRRKAYDVFPQLVVSDLLPNLMGLIPPPVAFGYSNHMFQT